MTAQETNAVPWARQAHETRASLSGSGADRLPLIAGITCGWMTLNASFFLAGEPGTIIAPAVSFLIDHPQGFALFDTGFGPRMVERTDGPLAKLFQVASEDRIDLRLLSMGIDPADVRWIINSHMHLDHAGGNIWLPEATVVVQAQEWDFARAGVDRSYHASEVETGHKVQKVVGEHDLFGDGTVVAFPTPGHTPGHQSVRVKTATGVAILSGDCCNLKRSLDEMRLPESVFSESDYRQSLAALRTLRAGGARIFFGHDPDDWAGVPKGEPLRLDTGGNASNGA